MTDEKLWKIFLPPEQGKDESLMLAEKIPAFPSSGMSRRTFIEMIGFSAAALVLNGCKAPEQKIIPYVKQPVEMTPGTASWYASTCGGCSAACGILVKVRDGRPIKLEGNPEHPLSSGGLCAMAHGMVFSLFDSKRQRKPSIRFDESTWEEVDKQIIRKLAEIKRTGGKVRVLTSTLTSPTSKETVKRFVSQFADGKHITYQPISNSAIRDAHVLSHQVSLIPFYRFDKAKVVVSFSADFLGTWISPVQFTRAYSNARNLRDGQREMLRHIQFESRLSLTGSNADKRLQVSPTEEIGALLLLANLVKEKKGAPSVSQSLWTNSDATMLRPAVRQAVEETANELLKFAGKTLVVSGSNDVDVQYLVNFINDTVGNYGKTLDLHRDSLQNQGDDRAMAELVREINSDQVAALIISGVNPAYDYFDAEVFTLGLSKVPLKISLNPTMDETSAYADYLCPQHHFLESWDDAEPVRGIFSLTQPSIAPLFQTRAYQESLLRWMGDPRPFYDVLKQTWKEKFFTKQKKFQSFDDFWDHSLQDGIFVSETDSSAVAGFIAKELNDVVHRLRARSTASPENLSVVLYEKVSMRDGTHANNPWLQELPDPVSKITWDNYACISPNLASKRQLQEGQVVRLSRNMKSLELPVHIQRGQHDACIGIALGYGRTKAGPAGNNVGINAFPLVSFGQRTFEYCLDGFRLEKTADRVEFASTQLHQTADGRPIIKELTLAEYIEQHKNEGDESGREPKSLWKDYQYPEHKWGMVIDLNACIGCSACLLSCQAENNVPVVGKEEVRRQREMHWIRIDRYFEGPEDDLKVVYQPVMCAQCDNASCESVCPVLATVHSSEGLNMQVYNRCVGTRYCENNCPYKVRRFNWFDHDHSDAVANLALNPDVTVRTRGVMEKCTFCVQRIEAGKIRARNEGRSVNDGEIRPACQQSCPAHAIIWGDLVDLKSRARHLKQDDRNYVLLEELNLRPAISYLAKVRNEKEAGT